MSEFLLLHVFCCTNNQGKGLFATRDYAEGDIIFVERPLVSAQFAWNAAYKYLACDHCMQSLETAEQMVRRLTGNSSLTLPHAECCSVRPSEHVVCHYCSVSCIFIYRVVQKKRYPSFNFAITSVNVHRF